MSLTICTARCLPATENGLESQEFLFAFVLFVDLNQKRSTNGATIQARDFGMVTDWFWLSAE